MSITRELQTTGATPVASRLSRGGSEWEKKPQISDFCHHKADTSPPGVFFKDLHFSIFWMKVIVNNIVRPNFFIRPSNLLHLSVLQKHLPSSIVNKIVWTQKISNFLKLLPTSLVCLQNPNRKLVLKKQARNTAKIVRSFFYTFPKNEVRTLIMFVISLLRLNPKLYGKYEINDYFRWQLDKNWDCFI